MKELIETTLEEARQTLESFLEETTTVGIISQAASTCAEALKAGNKIISCGNGGSLCTQQWNESDSADFKRRE